MVGNGALLLAPGSDGEPGSSRRRELSEQDWSRCLLAVLSACLTAEGEDRGPVNNESLVRALLSAGAHRVMAARWSVDSQSTRHLMESFYLQLLRGETPARALAASANEVASASRWKHPTIGLVSMSSAAPTDLRRSVPSLIPPLPPSALLLLSRALPFARNFAMCSINFSGTGSESWNRIVPLLTYISGPSRPERPPGGGY